MRLLPRDYSSHNHKQRFIKGGYILRSMRRSTRTRARGNNSRMNAADDHALVSTTRLLAQAYSSFFLLMDSVEEQTASASATSHSLTR